MFIHVWHIALLGVCMAHDIIKTVLALAFLFVVVAAMALFVSGYLSAYKSSGQGAKVQGPGISSQNVGHKAATATPTIRPRVPNIVRNYYPQAAQYQPAVPMTLEMPQAEAGIPQPIVSPSPTPVPGGSFLEPTTPYMQMWSYIIQDLLKIFPALFSGRYKAFPQWPLPWF